MIFVALASHITDWLLCATRPLKNLARAVEKCQLHPKTSDVKGVRRVLDLVRAMVIVQQMDQVAAVVEHLGARQDLDVVRIKERFCQFPSEGGWRDVMINVVLTSDPKRHICEIQVCIYNRIFNDIQI